MSRTVTIESLPQDAQRVIEELFAEKEPVILSRDGYPLGELVSYSTNDYVETPEERAAILASVRQGDLDFAAGLGISLEEFEARYLKESGSNGGI